MARITGTLHRHKYTFLIISCSVLLRMRNAADKSCRENKNTHFTFSNIFLKIAPWDNMEKYCTAPQVTDANIMWSMCFACWITKLTDTHSIYETLIAFPLQQWLHIRTSVFCYTYIACLVRFTSPCYFSLQAVLYMPVSIPVFINRW
jgi:hypothetical protein